MNSGNFLLTFWDNLSVPTGCLKTSVRNYKYLLHNNPEERSSQVILLPLKLTSPLICICTFYSTDDRSTKKYNFYLVIEVPDHVYVFYVYRLYFADKDIYMIRYFYHKIEIIRVFIINSIDIGIGHTRSTKGYNAMLY